MKKLFLLGFLLCFYGCLPVSYEMSMVPSTSTAGEYATYKDGSGIEFEWSWQPFHATTGYSPILTIRNNSTSPMQIIWSSCVVVEDDTPHPIYDTLTVEEKETLLPLKDTIIPPNTNKTFSIARSDNVYDQLNVAVSRPILLGTSKNIKKAGDTFDIYILADVGGNRNNYRFTFTVEDVR